MVNLLPPYWRKKLEEEEIFKTIIILGIMMVSASLAFVMMLILAKVYLSVELKEAQIAAEEKNKEMEIFGIKAAEEEITTWNKFIVKVGDFYNSQVMTTEMISRVAGVLPAGVTLSELSLAGNTVVASGYSPDRNSLILLKDNLENEKSFKSVVFPPENWISAQSIVFSINLQYEP